MSFKYLTLIALAGVVAGCNSDMHNGAPATDEVKVVAVQPQANSVGIDVGSNVSMTFTHAMMQGMEQYLMLHESNEQGPTVNGAWSWSNGNKTLVFAPAAPLKHNTTYFVHLKSGMMESGGHMVSGSMMNGMMGGDMTHGEMSYTFTTN